MALDEFQTGEDLLLYTLRQGGQSASTSDKYATLVKANLNQAYWTLLGLEEWDFARAERPGVLTTAARQAVTVTSISGSAVTLSASLATSQVDKKFYLDANQAYYRITAHTAGTANLTLDATYVETETAGQATIYQDEYALATDVLKPWNNFYLRGQFEGQVPLLEEHEFRARYGNNTSHAFGLVEAVALIRYTFTDADQAPVVQIAPWTEDRVNLEYEYAQRHVLTYDGAAATDTPRVPREYRWVIGEWALWLLFRKKSDTSIIPTADNLQFALTEMRNRFRRTASRPRFHMRPRHSLGGAYV